ncbi:hypothetical protein BAC2_01545 [uncultured bacterium]|nr:hypothetical protein BAC2_01545 [uncultured bacterium]
MADKNPLVGPKWLGDVALGVHALDNGKLNACLKVTNGDNAAMLRAASVCFARKLALIVVAHPRVGVCKVTAKDADHYGAPFIGLVCPVFIRYAIR